MRGDVILKNITKEQVLSSQTNAENQIHSLIANTDMEDNDDRKRTKNYCDWISKKTDYMINEKAFNEKDPIYSKIKRGSVIWVEFGFNIGVEFGGKHPAIVLRRAGSSIFVIPLSSQMPREIKPNHVRIDKVYGFKNLIRWANVLKMQNVSIQRVDISESASIGNVKGDVLNKINEAIKNTHIY